MQLSSDEFEKETRKLFDRLSKENKSRIWDYDDCELECDFLGFVGSYCDLPDKLPKDFTIIDIGACQAVQALYFEDFKRYIAVEPAVPKPWLIQTKNSYSYMVDGEEFIRTLLPMLIKNGTIDLNKTFCVCSYVPAFDLTEKLVPQTFPYHRVEYIGRSTLESFPPAPERIKTHLSFYDKLRPELRLMNKEQKYTISKNEQLPIVERNRDSMEL